MSKEGMMTAVRVHAPGGPEALQTERVPVPEPGLGEVLVRVEAAGVNFIEVYQRSGLYRIPLPATLGGEGAGKVVALGPNVRELAVGDRVAWAGGFGTYSEYAAVAAPKLVPLPDGVGTRIGAAVMLQGMTAHYLTTSTYPLREGESCLIHAAAGGVGLLLVQMAKMRGARVIGTAGSEEKAKVARAAGADEVIVYTRQDFVAEVHRITGGEGVHVVYDSVGNSTFLKGLDVLAPRGMMVLFGQSSGSVEPIDPQILNQKGSLFLSRPSLVHYTGARDELLHRANDVFRWIEEGKLDVRIGAEYPLPRAADAHRALEGRRTVGKVLLVMEGVEGDGEQAGGRS
jgi:NADPH:quinone reductase